MKFILSSAILAQILSSTTTSVSGEGKRFFLNQQRRAARARRLGKELLSSFAPNKNPAETPLRTQPLRNTHQDLLDRASFSHLRSPTYENNAGAEADVGLLAYQSLDPAGDVAFQSEDPGSNRRLEIFCDWYVESYGGECDCSQVDATTFMGTASCARTSEEFCYCPDMDLGKQICWSYTASLAMEGNITTEGKNTKTYGFCLSVAETYLEKVPVPLLCINYSYDEYRVAAEECTMMLGDSVCNSCTTTTVTYGDGNYTNQCFDFDCENLGSAATGSKVGSTCPGTHEWPLVTFEFSAQNLQDNLTDAVCPVEDSGPDDSTTPPGDDAPPPEEETPSSTDGVVHTRSSLSAMGGGALMLIAWLFGMGR